MKSLATSAKAIYVERVQPKVDSLMPSARTYHASCLIGKYMVTIGGEANTDLKDFWALDLEGRTWHRPEIDFKDYFTPKRFHTVNTLSPTQIVSFGGCHSEYIHMNEMHIFDMAQFLSDPLSSNCKVIVTRVNVSEGVPSTRWGHAAATYQGKLYILGGRNESDINDLHEFSLEDMSWKEIEIVDPKFKPRRRHSAVFISGSLITFGGFDGSFFNDMNILDLQATERDSIKIP